MGQIRSARTRSLIQRLVLGGAGVALVAVFWSQGLERAALLAGVAGFVVAAATAVVSWQSARRRVEAFEPEHLDRAAGQMADASREQWRAEERLLRLQDPAPIPVRWTTAPAYTDHWVNIGAPDGLELSGRLEAVAAVFSRIPSRRLVVLGPAGAGKSVLVTRLALDLLASDPPGKPPVVVPIAGWNPARQGIYEFVANRLVDEHRSLGREDANGKSLALALLESGRILLVLDGLDEMPEPRRPAVFRTLNATLNRDVGVVLTSRPEEYRAAVEAGDVLTGAAAIEIQPLTAADLRNYLPRTTRPGRARPKWEPVLQALDRADPAVSQALTTPLMTSLARTIYSDTDADPAELLDTVRFPDRRSVEEHLLDTFISSVYDRPPGSGPPARWTGAQARRWLGFLADRLESEQATDLAWWQITTRSRVPVVAFAAIPFGAVLAVTAGFGLTMPVYGLPIPAWLFLGLTLALPYGYATWRAPARTLAPQRLEISVASVVAATLLLLPFVAIPSGLLLLVILYGMNELDTLGIGVGIAYATASLVYAAGQLRLILARQVEDVTTVDSPRRLYVEDRRTALWLGPVSALGSSALILLVPGLLHLSWSAGDAMSKQRPLL